MDNYELHTDGGSVGNPGPGSVGWILTRNGAVVAYACGFIGEVTNNVAEYEALIRAAKYISETENLKRQHIRIFSDSRLLVEQIKGNYKIGESLAGQFETACEYLGELSFDITWIPRLQNQAADQLVNIAHRSRQDYEVINRQKTEKYDPLANQLQQKQYADARARELQRRG